MHLGFLQPVVNATGPFATVCLDATRSGESGAHQVELRWRALRERLEDREVPRPILQALEAAALAPTGLAGPHGRMLVAAGGELLLDRPLPQPPQPDSAGWDAVPDLLPFVRQYAWQVPHLLVVTDRTGADLTAFGFLGEEIDEETVSGDDHPLRKVSPGGWSQKRFQQRAENLWLDNADAVARQVDRLVAQSAARLVAVAGDVRAVAALKDHLGERASAIVVELRAGGRGSGVDEDALRKEVAEAVRVRAVEAVIEVTDRFQEELGRQGAAVEGLAAVVTALRKAQVDTLLLRDDPPETTQLYVGPEPLLIGVTEEDVRELGVEHVRPARGDAALVAALAASDASIVLVPRDGPRPANGIGALLRYADPVAPA